MHCTQVFPEQYGVPPLQTVQLPPEHPQLPAVPAQVVPVDTCPPVHVPAPLHASLIIVCPEQVYVVPAQLVIAYVFAAAFVQLPTPATQ